MMASWLEVVEVCEVGASFYASRSAGPACSVI